MQKTSKFVVLAAFLLSTLSAIAQPTFFLNSTFTGFNFLIPADINNDGRPDLFTGTGVVALNRGDGTFNTVPTFSGNFSNDRQTAAADVNGDGWMDFVTADFSAQTITLLTNHLGTLSVGQSITIGNFPTAVSAGDVNGDGLPDLAVASRQSHGPLTVLTNYGPGDFSVMATITNGIFGPIWVRLADINGDHLADLICADLNSSVFIFTNASGTNFVQSCVLSNIFTGSPSVVRAIGDVADVNGDGKPDLLCPFFTTSGSLNEVNVATNSGNGIFKVASTTVMSSLSTGTPNGELVIAADFNGDSKMDFVFQSEPDNKFTVATNRGDGVFAVATTMVTGSTNRTGLAVADLNNDGKPDVITSELFTGLAQVYLNTSPTLSTALLVAPSGTQSNVVYWTAQPGQFTLQSTTNLSSPNWQNVTDGTPVTGILLSNSTPTRFFRLQAR
jgi:FG-GAP-like repeat